ncbi:GntR family transcriptional regulator [Microbacterium sp. NPDC055683]
MPLTAVAQRPATTLADAAHERLAEEILSGRFAEGETLDLSELAGQLGISRMPVREACVRLAADGLVEIEPSRWTRVAHVTAKTREDARQLLANLLGMMLWMALPADEGADRLAAHSADLRAAEEADELLETLRALAADLVELAGNDPLARIWRDTERTIRYHLRDGVVPVRRRQSALADALDAKDPERAARAVRGICG